MLKPNSDRLDYGSILAPEANYKLDFAIGTTYSLDLDALIGGCIALGLSEDTDSELLKNPVYMLEALRSTGDKVALFCEAGQIHYPNKTTALYILLEKIVFQVITTKVSGRKFYPSFHPKFWLIRYSDKSENIMYKVAVLSRNLTFDRSWDVSFCMKGVLKKRRNENSYKAEPIQDFFNYLIKQLPKDSNGKMKAKWMKTIIEELPFISFDLNPENNNTAFFSEFDFIPNGIASEEGIYSLKEYPLYTKDFSELLIMSPFLSRKVIHDFNVRGKKTGAECILITRALELCKLKKEDCDQFKIYTMKDEIVDGESMIGDDSKTYEYQKEDIHAKIYYTRYSGNKTDLYLGSVNASDNGLSSNKEFMMRLKTVASNFSLKDLKSSLFTEDPNSPENPFQEANITTAVEDKEQEQLNLLDKVAKEIIRLNIQAEVFADGEDYYSLVLSIPEFKSEFKIEINPLLSKKIMPIEKSIVFSKLTIMQLSEFFVFSISDDTHTVQRILKIETKGIPENRDNKIVTEIVNNKECFYRYVAFLLGDNFVLSAIEANEVGECNSFKYSNSDSSIPALYEKMLSAAAYDPEKFKEIEYLIKAIDDNGIIPESFVKLYETFKKVVKING